VTLISQHAAPDVSLMLLGTKIDLDNKEVQTHEGKQVKKYLFMCLHFVSVQFSETHEIPLFFEVSAKTGQGVRQVRKKNFCLANNFNP